MTKPLVAGCMLVAFALVPTVAGADSPPPGATARCRDGSYSFLQHHQGTCLHHRGAAVWLDGSPAASSSATTTTRSTAGPKIPVGATVLLAAHTKTTGCELGPDPDRACSPGAYYSKLTKAVICSPTFHTDDIRYVPQSEKYEVEKEYGMKPKLYGRSLE